jgi:hypothetical protein
MRQLKQGDCKRSDDNTTMKTMCVEGCPTPRDNHGVGLYCNAGVLQRHQKGCYGCYCQIMSFADLQMGVERVSRSSVQVLSTPFGLEIITQ